MGIFGAKTVEISPADKVNQALGVFQEAQENLQKIHSEFEAEKALLAEKLEDIKTQSNRIAGTLDKLKELCG